MRTRRMCQEADRYETSLRFERRESAQLRGKKSDIGKTM